MPWKPKKNGVRSQKSSGTRWKQTRAQKALNTSLDVKSNDSIHQRIEVDPLEFACLFIVRGGQKFIGPGIVRAFDADKKPVRLTEKKIVAVGSYEHGVLKMKVGEIVRTSAAVVPSMLDIDRGEAARWAERWEDVAALQEIRENLREAKRQMQVSRLLSAYERDSFVWCRQDVPDQTLRSVLSGSNNGKDPTRQSDSLVICFRADDGRYTVAEESWDGAWSDPDSDGYRERVGVRLDPLRDASGNEYTFRDEKEAQRAISFPAHAGKLERFSDRRDAYGVRRIANRLNAWTHFDNFDQDGAWNPDTEGKDLKKIYGRPASEKVKKHDEVDALFASAREAAGIRVKREKRKGKRKRIPNTQLNG